MSSNPNNAIGTNGAYGGRTSVEAFNDVLNTFTGAGILSGWECSPSSGMTVALGGVTGYRDVAVATDPNGAKTTINNRTSSAVEVTLDAAPSTNSRIDVIVAYVANPPQGSSSTVDNPGACGIIAVKGTVSASPSAPSDSAIRTAITADGAAGSTAYYVVLATISVVANVTTITSNYITQGEKAKLTSSNLDFTTIVKSGLLPQASSTFSLGWGATGLPIRRYGMFVVVASIFQWSSSPASGWFSMSETIPNGFRPTDTINVCAVGGGIAAGPAFFEFGPTGSIKVQNNGLDKYYGNIWAIWLTNDDFPE